MNRSYRWFLGGLLMLVMLFNIGGQAAAYSYGNPNEDSVATAYKNSVAALNQNPPDFAAARAQVESVKQDLDLHMGLQVATTLFSDLDAGNKEKATTDFQKVLVLNVARRLDNVDGAFANYSQAKTLLAKGFATYEALSPNIKAKDAALDEQLRKQFESALQALGNPGLFGVGVKEPDKAVFDQNKQSILSSLQTHFQMKSLDVGHFVEDPGSDAGKKVTDGASSFNLRNWLPIVAIVVVILGVILYARRRA